jgi:hypothetical protein
MKFADSRLGENVFDFVKVAAAQAAGMGPAVPSLPGGMQMPPPGYGAPPGYGGQPAYPSAPPGYTPPQYGGAPPGSTPVYATPVEDEEYEDEEYAEGEVEGQEAEASAQEEQEPVVTSEVDDEGVVRGNVPHGRPIGANADEPPQPGAARPKAPSHGAPPAADVPQMTEEEAKAQALAMIQGVEEAMNDNTPPDQLAAIIAQMAPPDQLVPFATAPLEQLVDQLVSISPGTMLGTFAGRQYLATLQASLQRTLNIQAS